ncbi:MAG TPA: hypothetical protein VF376_00770 [Thermoanaerobaculia bacterium]
MRVPLTYVLLVAAASVAFASSCTSSGTPGPSPGSETSANPSPGAPPSQPTVSAPPPAAAVPEQPTPSAESQAHRPYRRILDLKKSGASDEELLRQIRSENVNYLLTSAEIRELRDAGVSQAVLEAMLRSGRKD